MAKKLVFVSYRRRDSAEMAKRIATAVDEALPNVDLFLDTQRIDPGDPWPLRLKQGLENSWVLLAVIGPNWAASLESSSSSAPVRARRRLRPRRRSKKAQRDAPTIDYVQMEIEWMLERQMPVLPVLVDGASMPDQTAVPATMAELCRRQALSLRPDALSDDFESLAQRVRQLLKELPDTYHAGALSAGRELKPDAVRFDVGSWSCQVVLPDRSVLDLKFDVSDGGDVTGTMKTRPKRHKCSIVGSCGIYWEGEVGGLRLRLSADGWGQFGVDVPATTDEAEFYGKRPPRVGGVFLWTNAKGEQFTVKRLRRTL